jgi:hypothetical protein
MYFFNQKNSPADRKILSPIKAIFNINGISKGFKHGDLKSLFNSDEKFSCLISMGDQNNINFDYYQLLLENITVESFDYSLDINGFLNYSIRCSIDIDSEKGFKVIEKNTKKVITFKSSNGLDINSQQNASLGT